MSIYIAKLDAVALFSRAVCRYQPRRRRQKVKTFYLLMSIVLTQNPSFRLLFFLTIYYVDNMVSISYACATHTFTIPPTESSYTFSASALIFLANGQISLLMLLLLFLLFHQQQFIGHFHLAVQFLPSALQLIVEHSLLLRHFHHHQRRVHALPQALSRRQPLRQGWDLVSCSFS